MTQKNACMTLKCDLKNDKILLIPLLFSFKKFNFSIIFFPTFPCTDLIFSSMSRKIFNCTIIVAPLFSNLVIWRGRNPRCGRHELSMFYMFFALMCCSTENAFSNETLILHKLQKRTSPSVLKIFDPY